MRPHSIRPYALGLTSTYETLSSYTDVIDECGLTLQIPKNSSPKRYYCDFNSCIPNYDFLFSSTDPLLNPAADERSDLCSTYQEPIDNECLKFGERRWHRKHLQCSSCRQDLDPTDVVVCDRTAPVLYLVEKLLKFRAPISTQHSPLCLHAPQTEETEDAAD